MKSVSPKAFVLALLLAVVPSVSSALPDPSAWQASVVGTNLVMILNGTLTVNDFPVHSDNSLIGVFVASLPSQAVGAYALSGGNGGFGVAVNGNTGATTQNGAIAGEQLLFYYHDNVTGQTAAALDPGIAFAGSDPPNVVGGVALRVFFPPTITAFDNSGAAGARVLLAGANFSAVAAGNQVTFNGVPATVDNVIDGGHLSVTVPGGAQSGPIRIQTAGGAFVTASNFTVLPRITGFTPASGAHGEVVTVDGNNFGASPVVSVAGTAVGASAVTVVSDNQVTFAIPADVVSGPVSVATAAGTAVSAGTLTVFPTVTGLSPASGGVGDVVTIAGYNFDNTAPGATQVTFSGNVAATIDLAASSRTALSVRVPGGALDGPVTVATAGGQAVSADSFSITTRHFADPVATPFAMTLSGTVRKNGAPAPAGDEIAAWSVHRKRPYASPIRWEKTLVAHAVILSDGTLAATPVYGDVPATTDNVEGCVPGEDVLLELWSASEGKAYHAVLDGASGLPSATAWDNAAAPSPIDVNFVEGQRIPLRTGAWNLVSAGVLKGYRLTTGTLPANPLSGATYDNVAGASLAAAPPIKSIEGAYELVVGSDGVSSRALAPAGGTLRVLSPGYGYWVKAAPSATKQLVWMTWPGPLATGSETLPLAGGAWILIGYWGNERIYNDSLVNPFTRLLPVSAADNVVLPTIGGVWASIDGKYDRTVMADSDGLGNKVWDAASGAGTFHYLAPGYGYWIKTNSPATLAYPAGTR